MTNTFTAVFQEAEEGGYVAFVDELPGAISQVETIEEARDILPKRLARDLQPYNT